MLHDSLTGCVYPLNDLARRIIEFLQAPTTLEEILLRVARGSAVQRTKTERELRQMMLLGFFEQTCDEIRQKLRLVRNGETLDTRVLEGSRFGCQNSGACCRGYLFGPITQEEKLRIEALDPRKILPHLDATPFFVQTGLASGKPIYKLGTKGDTCVFHEQGSSCGLHRAFGVGAKPTLCQLYPLAAVATIDGVRVYDRGECATFAVSARSGSLLKDSAARIRSLVGKELYHPLVWIQGSWRCDYGLVLPLTRRLDDEARASPALEALHKIGHLSRIFISALAHCPLAAGQPEATVTETLQKTHEEASPSETSIKGNGARGLRALTILAQALSERVAPGETLTPSFIRTVSLLSEVCDHLLDGRAMSQQASAAVAMVTESDFEEVVRLSLRQQLFGGELLLDDNLPGGLLRIALVLILTLLGSRLQALNDGGKRVSLSHCSLSHMTIKRTLHRPEPHRLLRANAEQAWPILDALPMLARRLAC